ncbi:MAG: hypothetical protein AVDCRST_MAG11-746 [uncultured Gemmatimonadaceae bacterium]|uniref:Uncharacterized protein n=1 Tax=uncultured Gemmatimonadaceae bacterium TaxID=246130 RepID=A0A6J4KAM1_9BACT|nr:MAG: hypothetical protein AVDCRST_MAG11-746 [uncultured Gemmatimonadaceae bacterium]
MPAPRRAVDPRRRLGDLGYCRATARRCRVRVRGAALTPVLKRIERGA